MSLKAFDDLSWNIYQPLSSIRVFDRENNKLVPITKDIMETKVPIKPGDRIVIIRFRTSYDKKCKEIPVLTEPIRGNTVKAIMKALERGLHKPITSGKRGLRNSFYFEPSRQKNCSFPTKNEVVYSKIARYIDSHTRLKLIKKYENGTLKPFELYGDYRYFEGIKRKGNYLYFGVGS